MILRKMNASFGALNGRQMELGDGLNILTAPNEAGKSTWCAFLCTMLFGLDTSARAKQGVQPDKIRYAPWSGAPMAGSLEVEHEGRRITIRRWTEKANAPMQAFSATYTGTDDPVPGMTGQNAGEILTGVQREVFVRSAFVRQGGMALQSSAALEKRINAIVSSGEEDVSYSEVDKRLRQWQRHRKYNNRGAIPEAMEQLEATQSQVRTKKRYANEAAALDQQIDALRAEKAQAEKRRDQMRADQRRQALSELGESRQRLRDLEQKRADAAARCEQERDRLRADVFGEMQPDKAREKAADIRRRAEGLEKLARRTPPLWISFIFLLLFAAAAALAFVLPWKSELFCGGAVALVLFALVFLRLNEMKKTAAGIREDRLALLRSCGGESEDEVDAAVAVHAALWEAVKTAESVLAEADAQLEAARARQSEADDRLLAGLDFNHGDSAAARAGREVEQIGEQIDELIRRRSELEGRARAGGDPVALQSQALATEARIEELGEEYDALALAIETLAAADSELQSRFSPALSRRAAEHFRYLTDGRYDEIEVARDLSARALPAGDAVSRGTDSLSAGAGDQLYLALRLAVCELAMPEGTSCPMILDDALVSFDDARLARALDRLRTIAETRQILLFSCHGREAEYFKTDPAVTLLSVGEGKAEEHE